MNGRFEGPTEDLNMRPYQVAEEGCIVKIDLDNVTKICLVSGLSSLGQKTRSARFVWCLFTSDLLTPVLSIGTLRTRNDLDLQIIRVASKNTSIYRGQTAQSEKQESCEAPSLTIVLEGQVGVR